MTENDKLVGGYITASAIFAAIGIYWMFGFAWGLFFMAGFCFLIAVLVFASEVVDHKRKKKEKADP